jgi:hypothetical protein
VHSHTHTTQPSSANEHHVRRGRIHDIDEDVWAFAVDWDWKGEGDLRFVKQFRTIREGRRWGETKKYFHLYCPERGRIVGRRNGKIEEFRHTSEYRKALRACDTIPAELLAQWIEGRDARKQAKTARDDELFIARLERDEEERRRGGYA